MPYDFYEMGVAGGADDESFVCAHVRAVRFRTDCDRGLWNNHNNSNDKSNVNGQSIQATRVEMGWTVSAHVKRIADPSPPRLPVSRSRRADHTIYCCYRRVGHTDGNQSFHWPAHLSSPVHVRLTLPVYLNSSIFFSKFPNVSGKNRCVMAKTLTVECTSNMTHTLKYQHRDAEMYSTFQKTHIHALVPLVTASARRIVDETGVGDTDDNRFEALIHTTILYIVTSRYCGFHRWPYRNVFSRLDSRVVHQQLRRFDDSSKFYETCVLRPPASNTSRHY